MPLGHKLLCGEVVLDEAIELRLHTSAYTLKGSRFVDPAVGAVLLTLLLFLAGVVGLSTGPGPVLYAQAAAGQGGQGVRIFKFRIMQPTVVRAQTLVIPAPNGD